MSKLTMYVRQSPTEIANNFIDMEFNEFTIRDNKVLMIETSVIEPKLEKFLADPNDEDMHHMYALPMYLVVDLNVKQETIKALPAPEEKEQLHSNLPVAEALTLFRNELGFSSRVHGRIAGILESQGRKSIGAGLRGNRRSDWTVYDGVAAGTIDVLEKLYQRLGIPFAD